MRDGARLFLADPDLSNFCPRHLSEHKGPDDVKRERSRWKERVQQWNGAFLEAVGCRMYAHWAIGAASLHRILIISSYVRRCIVEFGQAVANRWIQRAARVTFDR